MLYAAVGFSVLVLILISLTAVATYYHRKAKVIRYAQPMFLYFLLTGLGIKTIGSVFYAVEPSTFACNAQTWFVVLGDTLILIPMIVKVSAINSLFRNAKKMKRVQINRSQMYKKIGIGLLAITIFLIFWTILDSSTAIPYYTLTDNDNESGGSIVEIGLMCGSTGSINAGEFGKGTVNGEFGNFSLWYVVQYVYQFFLLITAAVLAFQTRKVRQEFNESSRLAFVIYSNFFFFLLQLVFWILENYKTIDYILTSGLVSFILSLDALIELCIYFLPKLYTATQKKEKKRTTMELYMHAINGGLSHPIRSLRDIFVHTKKTPRDDSDETAPSHDNQGEDNLDISSSHLSSEYSCGRDSVLDEDAMKKELERCRKRVIHLEEMLKLKFDVVCEEEHDDSFFDSEENGTGRETSLPSKCESVRSVCSGVMNGNAVDLSGIDVGRESKKSVTFSL